MAMGTDCDGGLPRGGGTRGERGGWHPHARGARRRLVQDVEQGGGAVGQAVARPATEAAVASTPCAARFASSAPLAWAATKVVEMACAESGALPPRDYVKALLLVSAVTESALARSQVLIS